MKELSLVFKEIPEKKVAVVGDIMLDHYLYGEWGKNSPEADFRIVSIKDEKFAPGGAGNTAVNVASLGSLVYLVGQIGKEGKDNAGIKVFRALLFLSRNIYTDGILRSDLYHTPEKLRILVSGQQITRADIEKISCLEKDSERNIIGFVSFNIENFDIILVSDYEKGFITENIAKELVRIAKEKGKMLIVDTKPKHFEWFRGCYCIKPNRVEAEEFSGVKIESLQDAEKAGLKIKKELETNVLLTLGSMGMILFEEERTTHFTSHAREIFDVTGAGDTVLATFSLVLATGASMRQAADLANHAAAIVIAKPGTTSVTLEELKKSIS